MKHEKMRKSIAFIIGLAIAFVGAFGFLSRESYVNSLETFDNGGYILVANNDTESENINVQRIFESGTTYQKTYDDRIVFTDINSKKVSVDTNNFVHYNNNSLSCLSDSVLLDTDSLDETQISYYSISPKSTFVKAGNSYQTSNAGKTVSFDNFVWKMSAEHYMVVSDTIVLVVSDDARQSFSGYIEVQYIDDGVVHLVNQTGTYSTISSDAYLLLQNGIRIYLGSKNVSNEDEILMNLTQMVVNSDDNVEIIPDESYKNENVKDPQVIVNASDGENGKDGEQGDAGEAGDPGQNGNDGYTGSAGKPGTQGEPGLDADDIPYAGWTFEEENAPIFSIVDDEMNETFSSVDPLILFKENDSNLSEITYYLLDAFTNSVVKAPITIQRSNLKEFDEADNKNHLPESLRKGLEPSHTYTLLISAKYDPTDSGNPLSQTVFAKSFVTKDTGVNLKFIRGSADELIYTLTVDVETLKTVKDVDLSLYDANKIRLNTNNALGDIEYTISFVDNNIGPNDVSPLTLNETTGLVSFPDPNDSQYDEYYSQDPEVTVIFSGLKGNSEYYAKSRVGLDNFREGVEMFNEISLFVKGTTLKRTPSIGKPLLKVNKELSALVVTPGMVSDPDSAVQKYRYEFYEEGNDDKPAYSVIRSSNESFSITVEYNSDDGQESPNGLWKDKTYRVKTVLVCNDNEKTFDKDSLLSDPASLKGVTSLPKCDILMNTYYKNSYTAENEMDKTFASVADGIISIDDVANGISTGAVIKVTLKSQDEFGLYYNRVANQPYRDSQNKLKTETTNITQVQKFIISDDYLAAGASDGKYEIPFYFTGLIEDENYSITVEISEVEFSGASLYNKEIGSTEFYTAAYRPLYVSSKDLLVPGSSERFNFELFFHLDADGYLKDNKSIVSYYDSERTKNPTADAVHSNNTEELTIKSATTLLLDIYEGNSTGTLPNFETGKLNSAPVRIETSHGDVNFDYSLNYLFDSEFYKSAYISKDNWNNFNTANPDDSVPIMNNDGQVFSIKINEDFEQLTNDYSFMDKLEKYLNSSQLTNSAPKLFIRVRSLYDYTYAFGQGTSLYAEQDANKIPVGDELTIIDGHFDKDLFNVNSYKDEWVVVSTNYTKPSWRPETNTFKWFDNKEITYTDQIDLDLVSNLEASVISGTKQEKLDTLKADWTANKIDSTGKVGVTIQGNTEWLGSYANAVRYTIYNKDGEVVTKSYNNNSKPGIDGTEGWIAFDYSNNEDIPKYNFFFDVEDNESGLSLSRGEEFKVVMEVLLKNFPTDEGGYEIYPTDSEPATHVITNTLIVNKQKPKVTMIDYQATKGTGLDNYLVSIIDPDKALNYSYSDTDDSEQIIFKIQKEDDSQIDARLPLKDADGNLLANSNGLYSLVMSLNGEEQLLTYYSLKPENTEFYYLANETKIKSGDSLRLLEGSDAVDVGILGAIKTELAGLASEGSVSSGNSVYVVRRASNDKYFDVYVAVQTPNIDSIIDYKITLTKGSETVTCPSDKCKISNTAVVEYEYSADLTGENVPENYKIIRLGDGISVDVLTNNNMLNTGMETVIGIDVDLYYDTGNYGIYYASNGSYLYRFDVRSNPNNTYASLKTNDIKFGSTSNVSYIKNDANDVVKVKIGDYEVNFTEAGLDIVPKQVGVTRTISGTNTFTVAEVLPYIKIAQNTGLYYSKLTIQSSGTGNLISSAGLKIWYREKGTTAWIDSGKTVPLNTSSHDVVIENLLRNTEYEIQVTGKLNDERPAVVLPIEKKTGSFTDYVDSITVKTLNDINFDSEKTKLVAKVDDTNVTRNGKYLEATIVFDNVSIYDIEKSIQSLDVKIFNNGVQLKDSSNANIVRNFLTSETGSTELSKQLRKQIELAKFETEKFEKKDFKFVVGINESGDYYFPFEPSSAHEINGVNEYKLSVDVNYNSSDPTKTVDFTEKLRPWMFDLDNFAVLVSGVRAESDSDLKSINFRISVTDKNRIGTGPISGGNEQVTFVAELHRVYISNYDFKTQVDEIVDLIDENGNSVYVDYRTNPSDNSTAVVNVNDVNNTGKASSGDESFTRKVLLFNVDFLSNQSSSKGAFNILCKNLYPNNQYYLKLYTVADLYNVDATPISLDLTKNNNFIKNYSQFSPSYSRYTYDADGNITGASYSNGLFVRSSTKTKTPFTNLPEVESITPDFNVSPHVIYVAGTRLDDVNFIIYSIEDLHTGKVFTIKQSRTGIESVYDSIKLNIPNVDANNVPIVIDNSKDYYLTAYLFTDSNPNPAYDDAAATYEKYITSSSGGGD